MLPGPQLDLLDVEGTTCEKFYTTTNEISKTEHKCKDYPRLDISVLKPSLCLSIYSTCA